MNLRIWTIQAKTEEIILIATDEYFARQYADQAGFHGELVEIVQPTVMIIPIDEE